jgi:hypothetical protein
MSSQHTMNNLFMNKILVILLFSFLSACASGPKIPLINLDKLDSSKRNAINQIEILNQAQLENKKFKVLNIVEGHSCQYLTSDPPVTRTKAIDQLKYYANEISGDGITNIKCTREPTSLAINCWDLISCTAEVIKFEN